MKQVLGTCRKWVNCSVSCKFKSAPKRGGELGFQRFIRFLEYLYLFLVKCLKVFEWFFSFLDNSDESGKLRKSKEHNDVYWFPSQSESTPVPFQTRKRFYYC